MTSACSVLLRGLDGGLNYLQQEQIRLFAIRESLQREKQREIWKNMRGREESKRIPWSRDRPQTSFHLDLRAPCASGLDERGHQLRPVLRWRRAQGEEVGGQHLWVLCVRFLTDNREEKTLALLSNIFRRAHHIHIYVLCKYFANKTHADDDDDDDHTHREYDERKRKHLPLPECNSCVDDFVSDACAKQKIIVINTG